MNKSTPTGLSHILWVLKARKIPFEQEYKFHPVRRWRFDVAIPGAMVAIEYEGVFSPKSRHTTVNGYAGDSEKYNQAQILGWKVLRYTAKNYKQFEKDLITALEAN